MKSFEKAGWVVFLGSLAVFLLTLFYSLGKWFLNVLVELFHAYNANTGTVIVISALFMLCGIILIRTGSSQNGSGSPS